jgi:hypothetical protein
VLLLFTQPACGACRAMTRALVALDPPLPGLVVLAVDAGAGVGLVEEHGVFHLPALFLYTDRDFHGAVGAPPLPEPLAREIAAVAAGPRSELP